MNLYLWLFALYALLITPVRLRVHLLLDGAFFYRISLQVAGVPFLVKKREEQAQQGIGQEAKNAIKSPAEWDHALLLALLRQGHLTRLIRLFAWQDVEIRARISFADAALTAVTYALVQVALETAAHIRPLRARGGVEMDFRGEGSRIALQCIAQARLGKLMAAAIRLWLAVIRHRMKEMKMEEEQHAAASH